MTFDDIRARHPHLGLALYALEPLGDVIVEAHGPNDMTWTWRGKTAAEALLKAFPPAEPAPSQPSTSSVLD